MSGEEGGQTREEQGAQSGNRELKKEGRSGERPSQMLVGVRLEGGGNAEPEGLARFAEEILRTVGLDSLLVRVVACAARREHIAGNQLCRAALYFGSEGHVVAIRPFVETSGLYA